MRCEDVLPLIEKLADGECTETERARAEAHLAECESCREHFRFVQALPEAARMERLAEPPGAYWDVVPRKVMARIEKEQSIRARGWLSQILSVPRLRWMGAIAAGVIAVVLSYEVLTLERERKPVTVTEPAEEAVVEETVPPQPSKTATERSAGEAAKRADKEKPDVGGGVVRREPPSPTPVPAREGASAPARLREAAPTGKTRALQESEKEEVDHPSTPEPISNEVGAAGRGRTIAEAEEATVAAVAEDVRGPREAPANRIAQTAAPKLKAAEPSSQEPSKMEVETREADQVRTYSVRKQTALERKGVKPVGFSQKDRETTSVSGAEREAECRALRDSIDPSVEIGRQEEIRYRLALCSIELYHLRQTEDDRHRAEEDASAYLETFPEGEHADEIKRQLDEIRK